MNLADSHYDRYPILGRYCRAIDDIPRDGDGRVVAFCNDQQFVAMADIVSGCIPRGTNVRIIEYYPPDFVIVEPLAPRS